MYGHKPLTSLQLDGYCLPVSRTVGQNVRRIRETKGLTQEVLAQRLGLKRPAQMSIVESSQQLPKPATILRYAKALGCDPRLLMDDVETPYDRIRAGLAIVKGKKARAPSSGTGAATKTRAG